ncbi:P27 family phage terminase small subunit [Paremcibacter congregatus]|uniref:P27 family phage terminase small subunit n=1 Tax=Paremcibacter congregatus TaxID=2043170 RepID=UPI003A9454B5
MTVEGRDVGPEARRLEAEELAASLKPNGLPADVAAFWDDVAVALAEKNRLDPLFVWSVAELCHCLAKMAEYRAMFARKTTVELEGRAIEIEVGETYAVKGRNGTQIKARPEVAQFNETRRMALRLIGDFGMNPVAARSLTGVKGQGDLFDDLNDFASDQEA